MEENLLKDYAEYNANKETTFKPTINENSKAILR